MTVTGALIMGLFATVWWVVGFRSAGYGPWSVYTLPLVVAALLGGAAWHVTDRRGAAPDGGDASAQRARRNRLVGWASAGEGLVIFLVAGVLLPSTGHQDATVPAVALIVAAHFVPLARGLPAPTYYLTAAALTGFAIAGFLITAVTARVTVVSGGAALVLWLTAAAALYRVAKARRAHPRTHVA